ncbi:MAG: pyridoxamine 5'-phosphate oxidase family protein [Jaaginema sp. PMC 1079.18]|nr:pyridoxamine 5'-phosphate oxidase family protein [Jaaginema sp. PMC 1080.18]MEC4852350.1 pyridoxamine 5'-phosphate oxidase family protein [Jaaginema sp. PMC 1079.18]MEC4865520.1 pyridoxamine 5'-phosphate oxidase family protein [Jaaginema sp. PMC 1078.18]
MVVQPDLAPWRSLLARALHRNRSQPQSRYFQLATVQADGKPANRTVVFRGFATASDRLKIISDRRSQKIEQIQQQPWGEICWYFSQSREQFRFAGTLNLVTEGDRDSEFYAERRLTWQNLSDTARLQFAWPPPKEARSPNPGDFEPSPPSPATPLDNFCLLLLNPHSVDYLNLRGEPQNRHLYWQDNSQIWRSREVNP